MTICSFEAGLDVLPRSNDIVLEGSVWGNTVRYRLEGSSSQEVSLLSGYEVWEAAYL